MQPKEGKPNSSITIGATGRSTVPLRRSSRVTRVQNYADLVDDDSQSAEPGIQSPPLGSNSRRRGAAIRRSQQPTRDADYEGHSSSGDEGDSSDDDEQLAELSEDEQAADAADMLAQLADAAMQDDQQHKRGQAKSKYTDAR